MIHSKKIIVLVLIIAWGLTGCDSDSSSTLSETPPQQDASLTNQLDTPPTNGQPESPPTTSKGLPSSLLVP